MKLFVTFLATVLALSLWAEDKPAPTMPEDVTLTSGRVLHHVSVVRWEKDRVVLKYAGGTEPVHFSLFKSLSREDLLSIRDAEKRKVATVATPKNRVITGQVFVTTRGAGAYRFSAAVVDAFTLSALESARSTVENEVSSARVRTGKFEYFNEPFIRYSAWIEALRQYTPLASTTTDADGNYKITFSNSEPVFLFCPAHRLAGGEGEYNIWAVPVGDEGRIDLNNRNSF